MPKYVKFYKDKEKCRITRNKQRKQNYRKTAFAKNGREKWQQWEMDLVLEHETTDFELSKILERSVQSIQTKRYNLKKEKNND